MFDRSRSISLASKNFKSIRATAADVIPSVFDTRSAAVEEEEKQRHDVTRSSDDDDDDDVR